ncbi:MAG TPA: T9SS type A sorting domain-containing protein [Bacteroidia bacterium]|nr:T9SS type A sorting domain-containing protein [Bacteroidia bacterium]
MISKKLLLIIFILSVWCRVNGQSTWIYNLSYHTTDGFSMLDNDNVSGIQVAAISPDSSVYMIAKIWPDHFYYLYKFDLTTDTIAWSMYLQLDNITSYITDIKSTADSGFIFYLNDIDNGGTGEVWSTIYKYDKNGNIQWSDTLPEIPPYGGHWTYDVIQNNAGNYFALLVRYLPGVTYLLYEYDNSGTIIDSLPVQGRSLFQMPNNDLLIQQTNQLFRMDLSGNIAWTLPGAINLISWDTSAVFICNPDTTNGIAVIKKVNPQNGGILWTDTINQPNITSIDGTSDGGVIISTGIPVTYSSQNYPPPNMNGQLIKLDLAGTIQWSKTYVFNEYGFSFIKELSPGNYLTSGTYYATDFFSPVAALTPNAFIATIDSAGNSILETTSYMWPGDANHNDTMYAPEDVLYTGIALGKTGPRRIIAADTLFGPWIGSAYAFDWTSLFPNGVNVKHADFDNNGVVDTADVNLYLSTPILWDGYILSWRSSSQLFSTQPDFVLQPEKDSVAPGEVMRFYVIAGNAAQPIDSVYGIAFSAYYDYYLTDMSVPSITISNSDFGILGTNFLGLSSGAPAGSDIRMVFSKTDNLNAYNLYDTLGVIELTAYSGITSPQAFALQISSFYALTNSTSPVAFNTINGSVVIDAGLVNIEANALNSEINIFPNPVRDKVKIKSPALKIEKIEIRDVMGKTVLTKIFADKENIQIDVDDLDNGVYFLKVYADKKAANFKFVLNN